MNIEYYQLYEDILFASEGKKVTLLTYPGNWGDALIRSGSIAFLKHFNIDYEEIFLASGKVKKNIKLIESKLSGRLLLVSGGGAWTRYYPALESNIRLLKNRFKFRNMIVLPSTFDKHYDIEGVQFYRRDEYQSKENMPDTKFCHDMAFFLEYLNNFKEPTKKAANIFRVDEESSQQIEHTADNFDLSKQGNERSSIYDFFNILSNYESINTDRLHVAIAGSMIGRDGNLYPGAYFKNEAIFRTSLEKRFPKTRFINP